MNSPEDTTCSVCFSEFDTQNHIPKILPSCGHSICSECLTAILKDRNPRCPLDKSTFDAKYKRIDDFPKNFLALNLLETQQKQTRCPVHNKFQDLICLDDHTLVCSDCVIFGDHKRHDVKKMSDFEGIAKQKRAQLQAISEKLSDKFSQKKISLYDKHKITEKAIQRSFNKLRHWIDSQESAMLINLVNLVIDEENHLENAIGKSSDLAVNVQAKLKELENIMENPNITKVIEQGYTELEKQVDKKLNFIAEQSLGLPDLLNVLERNIQAEEKVQIFEAIEFCNQEIAAFIQRKNNHSESITIPGTKNLLIFQSQDKKEFSIITDSSQDQNSEFTFAREFSSNPPQHLLPESFTFSKSDLEKIRSLHYELNLSNCPGEVLTSLIQLPKFLENVKELVITLTGSADSEIDQIFFCNILSIHEPLFASLEKFKVHISKTLIRNFGVTFLFETILSQMKALKNIVIFFTDIKNDSDSLRKLAEARLKSLSNLEKFHFANDGVSFTGEEDLIRFFDGIPNVKDLSISLNDTLITDYELKYFSNILPCLNKVKKLSLSLSNTKISDVGVEKLWANLLGITNLSMDLDNTLITDASIESLFDLKTTSLKNLKHLYLSTVGTQVSDEEIIQKFDDEEDWLSFRVQRYH